MNQSGYQAAALLPGGTNAVVAYQQLRYRPATGIAAFPDGGVPKYSRDSAVIATVGLDGSHLHVLQHVANLGAPGSASLSLRVVDADPDHVLVVRSVQPSQSDADVLQFWRLGLRDGSVRLYPDLRSELQARGLRLGSAQFGDVRVVDSDGTLLIGVQAKGQDELWLRRATGQYVRLDALTHFYGIRGAMLYYWSGNDAVYLNWNTGERRIVAHYDSNARLTTNLVPADSMQRAIENVRPAGLSLRVSSDRSSVLVHLPNRAESVLPLAIDDLQR